MMGYSLRTARETDYDRLLPICKEFYLELGPTEALSNITSTLKRSACKGEHCGLSGRK